MDFLTQLFNKPYWQAHGFTLSFPTKSQINRLDGNYIINTEIIFSERYHLSVHVTSSGDNIEVKQQY